MLKAFKDFPHSYDAVAYAFDVVNGHLPNCQEVIKACQRFIDDFDRDFEYLYDPAKAERACDFIELMPHTKGRWAAKRESLKLEPWQKFGICNLFGWVNAKGARRFRKAYFKIPRKNGKSIKAAAIGQYMFACDDEFGAEIYSGATTEKQAWEVFGPARLMAKRSPDYCDAFGIEVNAKNMVILENGSKFEPIIGDPGDGSSPSLAIIDELHEHQSPNMIETMETGQGAREQPMLLMITTAGDNYAGPCYEIEDDCKKLLDRVFEDEQMFCLMYGIDPGDDWTDPEILRKANPNYDVSISGEFLIAQQKQAIRTASKQNAFKRKHLNVWVGALDAWLNMEDVHKCARPNMRISRFKGCDMIIPVDLASRVDITAILRVISKEVRGKIHYYAFCRFYLPEAKILEPENAHYQAWVNDGHLISTEGNEIDFNEIQQDIKADMDKYGAKEITYDPWRATQLAQQLQADGANIVEFRNTVKNMSPAMYELEAAISSGRFHYDGNPVMTWMLSNVVARVDAKDNIYPRKPAKRNEKKIDGVVALIMAIGRFMANADEEKPYEDRGIRTL